MTPRPLTMQFTLADAYNLNVGEVFAELIKVGPDVRKAAYRDPEWRARAFDDLETQRDRHEAPLGDYEVSESERFPELVGRRVTDIARERNCSPSTSCATCRWPRTSGRGSAPTSPTTTAERGRLLTEDHVVLGLTDAGAHVDQLCDAPLPTDLLGNWVRERGVMPLSAAVRKLAGEPADMFGFAGRGYLRPGDCRRRDRLRPRDGGPGPAASACATFPPTVSG